MGNAESVNKNTDKRTSRKEHAATFKEGVAKFRQQYGHAENDSSVAFGQHGAPTGIRVCVRKRPIFPHETKTGEYDVITVPPGGDNGCLVTIHDARMESDLLNMYMNHHTFKFDAVFSEKCTNDDVYNSSAKLLVSNSCQGQQSTIMMYGQTGSGKTYTMTALQERAFPDVFRRCGDAMITVSFVELVGDKCFDMLNVGQPVNLTTGTDGGAYPYPCVEVEVSSAAELMALVHHANSLRATAATGVHDHSSRSHAICRIYINKVSQPEGVLTLVDLAGSEHKIDSDEHNAARRKEGALINASLSALKDCVRANARGASFVGYRNNRLTQLLKTCFDGNKHSTIIIATISPSAKDTEHSLNTLRHACIMDGQGTGEAAGSSHVTGGSTIKEKLGSVNVAAVRKARREALMKERQRIKAGLPDPEPPRPKTKPPPAHQTKQSNVGVRTELDNAGMATMDKTLEAKLLEARANECLRDNALQKRRIRGDKAPFSSATAQDRERPRAAEERVEEDAEAEQPAGEGDHPSAAEESAEAGDEGAGKRKRKRGEGELKEKEPPAGAPADVQIDEQLVVQRREAAALWEDFKRDGRRVRQWRKNDLRLIATHILPTIPEAVRPATITWKLPEMALDELSEMLENMNGVLP